jgi:hypothetical protein
MPITSQHFTLSDVSATQIVPPDNMQHQAIMHNQTKSSNQYIWVGGSSTTAGTADGIHIDPGDTLYVTLPPGDELWASSTPSGLVVNVMDVRQAD